MELEGGIMVKRKLVTILTLLFVLSCFSTVSASENEVEVVTLEQAKELAKQNCRNLTKYEINTEQAKYQFY